MTETALVVLLMPVVRRVNQYITRCAPNHLTNVTYRFQRLQILSFIFPNNENYIFYAERGHIIQSGLQMMSLTDRRVRTNDYRTENAPSAQMNSFFFFALLINERGSHQ